MAIYQPHTPAHAIEQAVLGVRLLHDADDASFASAVKAATDLQAKFDLPGRLELDPMSLMFGRQVLTMGYRGGSLNMQPGVLFQRVDPAGSMIRELTVERSAVTLRTSEYDRWATLERLISDLLAPVAKALCSSQFGRVTAVELRCIDRFVAPNNIKPSLSDAIREESPLIPKYLLGKTDFLHSHTGWFEDVSDEGRVLINLNTDVGSDGDVRVLSILQVISRQSSGINLDFYGEGEFEDILLQSLNRNHQRDKALLGSILVDSVTESIGLEGASGIEAL